jgi:hypothetical protein
MSLISNALLILARHGCHPASRRLCRFEDARVLRWASSKQSPRLPSDLNKPSRAFVGLVGERYFPNRLYVRIDLSDTLLVFGNEHVTDTLTGQLTSLTTLNSATFAIGFDVHFWAHSSRVLVF